MKYEDKAIIENILQGAEVHYFGADDGCQFFKDMICNGTLYSGDAPDFYISKDDNILIIEHFEFDSYNTNRNGSTFRQELAHIDRSLDRIPHSERGVLVNAEIKRKSTYKNYVDNITRSFNAHYSQIDRYIERLKLAGIVTEKTNVKTMFLIEDSSPLGTYVVKYEGNNHSFIPVILANCGEFLSLLKQSNKLDYVLACSWCFREKAIWFIDRNNLDSYLENTIGYSSMDFIDFNPQVITYKRLISEDELIKATKKRRNEYSET